MNDTCVRSGSTTSSNLAYQGLAVPSTFTTGPFTSTAFTSQVSLRSPTRYERVFRTAVVVSQIWYQGGLYPLQDGLAHALGDYGQVPAVSQPMLTTRFVPQPDDTGSTSQPDELLPYALRTDAVSAHTTAFGPWGSNLSS